MDQEGSGGGGAAADQMHELVADRRVIAGGGDPPQLLGLAQQMLRQRLWRIDSGLMDGLNADQTSPEDVKRWCRPHGDSHFLLTALAPQLVRAFRRSETYARIYL
jgi:hypothetical protein